MATSLVSSTTPMQDLPCTQVKVDQFLLEWLAIEDTQSLVLQLTDSSVRGGSLKALSLPGNTSPRQSGGPPISPRTKSPRSPFSPRARQLIEVAAAVEQRRADEGAVPRFYYPNGKPVPKKKLETVYSTIIQEFAQHPEGLALQDFVVLVGQVFQLPEMLGILLHQKLADKTSGLVDKRVFTTWWEKRGFLGLDKCSRMFHVIKRDENNCIEKQDLEGLLDVVLNSHPSLEFLAAAPDFRQQYADTVVFRIQYDVCQLSRSDRIYLRQLKKHGEKLWEALENLDDDCEVNAELLYFSYEHFYVICCKFWELDTDHDLLIDQENLLHYSTCALTYKIIQRIFQGAPKALEADQEGHMNYRDFLYFILSEEDKTTDVSIEYWFKCLDLDGAGYLEPSTIAYFFEEQQSRMMCMNQETIKFEDIWAQISDMIKPADPRGFITLADLKRNRLLATNFFDMLFNIHKFWLIENQDPFAAKAEQQRLGNLSDWQRFALNEYQQMSIENSEEAGISGQSNLNQDWEESASDSSGTENSF
eukprot:TRINITY_DN607_c0_g1_i1.p1 TRINITY_DN607_c0_g1~~TRINITY_DN607_c0_g1_i1.p1  ORF type:complete len:603 (-),score=74.40 TRINITY_DN607_c0_g1_i1:175-1770(-)